MFSRLLKKVPRASAPPALCEMPVVRQTTDIDQLMAGELVFLFKHSAACPVSWMAHAHINRFRSKNPDITIHLVPVIEERAASLKIAEKTRVRHESPQLIALRNGVVASVASHEEITEDLLSEVVASVSRRSA